VIVSDALRRRRFGTSSPLGERLVLDRRQYTVVGVMPRAFEFPKRGPQLNGQPAEAFLPLVFNPFEKQARGMFYDHSVIGRLREGVTAEQAARDTAALSSRVGENYPARIRNAGLTLTIAATPLLDEIVGQVRRPLLILLGAVGLLLLVACANVANLFLGRAASRQREIGVRIALGAARHRLFQMVLVESLLIAGAGGILGLAFGYWAVRAVPAVIATSLPGVSDVTLDTRVVAFTLALSLATALFFGLVPFTSAARPALADTLREGARAVGGRRQRRLQGGLVVASVALAFVLLTGAGLLIQSFTHLMNTQSGVGAMHALSLEVALPPAAYDDAARMRSFYQAVTDRALAIPGMKAAVVTTDLPLDGDGERRVFTPEGFEASGVAPPAAAVTWAHGDYFGTFGIPIMRGRNFAPEEQTENRMVAIVSHDLADRYWPNQDPVGRRLKWGPPDGEAAWHRVIGVVGDVVDGPPGSRPMVHIYVPYSETPDRALASPIPGSLLRRMIIGVNAHTDGALLAPAVRAVIAAIDPALAVARVTTMNQVLRDASAPQRFSTTVLTAFAAGALLLAALGLYGVLAFSVAQRTREIGVRIALGARRGEVVRLVLGQGMVLVGIGLAVGFAGAVATTRVLRSLLFETQPFDPWTFAIVPVLLALVSLAAGYVPARRAALVDPIVTLRAE
jgi:putative ABC transport system permease protein